MDQQKKRLLVQQNWMQKQQKAKERMTTCFHKLKVCLFIVTFSFSSLVLNIGLIAVFTP